MMWRFDFQMAVLLSRPHVYSALETRIQVMEGVRNAFYCYADLKMEELLEIERTMTEELLRMWTEQLVQIAACSPQS